jgi:micrococcal nuclease
VKRAQTIQARITDVVDGDTIKVRAYGARRSHYTVRLIGIDTPETKKPGTPVECGGRYATQNMLRLSFTAPRDGNGDGLLDHKGGHGRYVTLRTDPSQATFDRYGRLLAYVTTRHNTNLAANQLKRGWAKVYVYGGKRFRSYSHFRDAQSWARSSDRGVWSRCGGDFHTPAY